MMTGAGKRAAAAGTVPARTWAGSARRLPGAQRQRAAAGQKGAGGGPGEPLSSGSANRRARPMAERRIPPMQPVRQFSRPTGTAPRRVACDPSYSAAGKPLACGYSGVPMDGKVCGAPAGECACPGIFASGNIAGHEQHAARANRAPRPRRTSLQGRPRWPDGARTPRTRGAFRQRRDCPGGLPVRPHGGDPHRDVPDGGSDAPERVNGERPLRRPKLRGRPDVSSPYRIPSARRVLRELSLCHYLSRPFPRCATSSFRRVPGGAIASASGPFLPLPGPHTLTFPSASCLMRAPRLPGRQPADGHGLGTVREKKGRPLGP